MDGNCLFCDFLDILEGGIYVQLKGIGTLSLEIIELGDGPSTSSSNDFVAAFESSQDEVTAEASSVTIRLIPYANAT